MGMNSSRFRSGAGCSFRAMLLAGGFSILAFPALAQNISTDADAATSALPGDIVVTGSRIMNSGFSAPTPVSVIGADRLANRGITSIGDALSELPAFRATEGATAQNPGNPYVGGRILDLRGLGPVRTLVLVDGRRFVPSTTTGTVDTNLIPSILLERAEVVTGGASAAYGSDAVAGVVNLILNKKLEGWRGTAQMGISDYGDDRDAFVGLAGGMQLSSRLHVVVGGEYQKNTGVGPCIERAWCSENWLNFSNVPAGSNGLPNINILPNIHVSTLANGGVINSPGALRGITFNPDGTARAFRYGPLINSLYMVGGEGGDNPYFANDRIKAATERYDLYGHLDWEATDSITAGLDVSYGRLEGHQGGIPYSNTAITIQRDNPFIPTSADPALDVRGILDANPAIPSFVLGRAFYDIGGTNIVSVSKTFRTVASLKGKLSDRWSWDAYYQYGHTSFINRTTNATVTAKVLRAVNAVRAPDGSIVCRDTLSADANVRAAAAGCVPLNPFGNVIDPAAINYVTGAAFQTNNTTQHVAAANINGQLIDLWAGPLSIAAGVEYRNDSLTGDTDAISAAHGFYSGNGSKLGGKVAVTEGYAEAELPLAKDMTLLQELSLNGAIRRTHYKRSSDASPGSTVNVTTWKVGAVWEPFDFIRFRATKSRDIRAPNISELFGPQTSLAGIFNDPDNEGAQTLTNIVSGSNPNLLPEKANTYTFGVVLQPQNGFLSRFRASIDYYSIKIADAIGTIGQQTIVNRCHDGALEFCGLISRDANNVVTEIRALQLNVNGFIARGVDIEGTYRQPLGAAGRIDLRVLATINKDLITVDSAGRTNRAGQTGLRAGTAAGVPDYMIDATAIWTLDAFNLTVHGRYIPSGSYNVDFIGPDDPRYDITLTNSVNNNRVKSATYIDLLAQYDVLRRNGQKVTFFAASDNIFNIDPPRVPGAPGTGSNITFNPVGRTFKVGARFAY